MSRTYSHIITIKQDNAYVSENEDFTRLALSSGCHLVRFKLEALGHIYLNTIRFIFAADYDYVINPVFDVNDMQDFNIRYEKCDDHWNVIVEATYN